MIHLHKPNLGTEEIEALSEVISSGYIGLGPKSDQFETELAAYIGTDYAVGLNSHTAALDLAIQILDIGPGDEVIVPTLSFLSAAHCVVHNGATPVFVDALPDTLQMDPADVARKITPRTRALIAFHYGGCPADIDALRRVTADHGIRIIEDVSDACGAEYKGAKAGSLGDLACFSFYSTKQLAAGDGGAITTNNAQIASRAKQLRWLGVDRENWRRSESVQDGGRRGYLVEEISLKCHMNDLIAAVAIAQLHKLDACNSRRSQIARLYFDGLSGIPGIQLAPITEGKVRSAWYTMGIQSDRRDALRAWLAQQGIATDVLYTPLHTYSCYGNRPALPVAETAGQRILSLPIHPGLADVEVFKIINAIKAFCMKSRSGHAPAETERSAPGEHGLASH